MPGWTPRLTPAGLQFLLLQLGVMLDVAVVAGLGTTRGPGMSEPPCAAPCRHRRGAVRKQATRFFLTVATTHLVDRGIGVLDDT